MFESPEKQELGMCLGLNSHLVPVLGDKVINLIVGVYIPIRRIHYILYQGGMAIPNSEDLIDPGTY